MSLSTKRVSRCSRCRLAGARRAGEHNIGDVRVCFANSTGAKKARVSRGHSAEQNNPVNCFARGKGAGGGVADPLNANEQDSESRSEYHKSIMFNFFNKKQNTKQIIKKEAKGTPFNIERHKADLQALYECSVQRTAKDFAIQQVAVDGGVINVAMDGLDGYDAKTFQQVYNPNFVGEEVIFTHFAANGFIGFNNCSILAQDWLINKCLALPCDDAISINYDLLLKEDDVTDEDKDIIEKLKNLSGDDGKYKIKSICKKFAENKRKYGQALCIPLVKDADYSVPFNIDAITSKSYKGMVVLEPIWVAPVLDMDATTNPMSKRFYKPTWFRMPDGTLVHYTWFIFNTYGDVPDILKPTYYFGGYPLPQQLYQQVYSAHKTAKEAPMLAQSKRLNYVEGNLNAFLADEEKLSREVNLMSWLRNNWGWLLIKKDQRIGQLDTSLTDFDAVTMLGYQLVSAISWVPSARLLETSPKGWQSTGSYEDRNYSKLQQSIQRQDYCPILDMHYRLLAKSEFDIDKHYVTNFDPIDTPTEKERAEMREINSRTDINYIKSGVITAQEVREVLREDLNSGYNALPESMPVTQPSEAALPQKMPPASPMPESGAKSKTSDAWEEWKHPRDKEGKFTEKGTGVSKSGGEHGRGQKEGSGVSKSGGEQGRGRSTPRLQQQTSPSPFMLRAVKRNPYGQLSPEAVKRIVQKARKVAQKLKRIGRVQNPKTIAGAKQGKPMTFEQADGGRANPHYSRTNPEYSTNCQSSVVAHEARMRGYNVQAAPNYETGKAEELSYAPFSAWLNPLSGKECKGTIIPISRPNILFDYLNNTVKRGQRYHFKYYWQDDNDLSVHAHIITLDRDKQGMLRLYDPQMNRTYTKKSAVDLIKEHILLNDPALKPEILRVDNKNFNPYYMNDVLKKY